MNGRAPDDWKKILYECKIQGTPLNAFFGNCYMYGISKTDLWGIEDYENFIKAYSVVLTQIEKARDELNQFETLKGRFEEVFKIKYMPNENNSHE